MEMRQFTYVNTVASCGSFTKAAAKLFISQPALSNYINKVEEELGVKLFDRSTNPITLTYAGEQYLKRTKVILTQIEDMTREMRDITHHMTGKIKLGFPGERIIYMLPLMLTPFKEKYPGIEVEVMTGPGNRLLENLRAGEVDFVFLPSWVEHKEFTQVTVAEDELVLVAAEGYLKDEHFLDKEKKIVNWREVSKLPLITLKKGHALRASVDVLYNNLGLKPNIILESHSNMLSYRLAAQGIGFSVVPEITLVLMQGGMPAEAYHLSSTPVTWTVNALYRKDCYIGEVEQSLLNITKEVMMSHKNRL